MEELSTEQMSGYMDTAIELAMAYGPRLLLAIIVLVVGLWIVNRIVRVMGKGLERSNTDPTLARFLSSLVSITLKALLLISVASMVGIATTSFVAILGAAGLAIGAGASAAGAATDMTPEQTQALAQIFGVGAQYGALLPFSRSHESIADEVGLDIMADAGFDPREAVTLWQNMGRASGGQAPPEFLSTHPSGATRIAELRAAMPRAIAAYDAARQAGRRPGCG